MSVLTQVDAAALVKEMNSRYQPPGRCVATPLQMNLLLKKLSEYTTEVQKAANREGLDDDSKVPQWAADMASWQQRLAHYQLMLNQVPRTQWSSTKGCEDIYTTVTAPLLDGIYYEVLPGIVLTEQEKAQMLAGTGHGTFGQDTPHKHPEGHSNPKPPDVMTPFSLGNQVLVYQQHQKERAQQFWADLKKAANALVQAAREGGKIALPYGVLLLGVAAVGGVMYLAYRGNRSPSYRPSKSERVSR